MAGIGISEAAPARTGHVSSAGDASSVYSTLTVTGGDSGAAVMTSTGDAVGLVIEGGLWVWPNTGVSRIIKLGPMLEQASHALGIDFSLAVADASAAARLVR